MPLFKKPQARANPVSDVLLSTKTVGSALQGQKHGVFVLPNQWVHPAWRLDHVPNYDLLSLGGGCLRMVYQTSCCGGQYYDSLGL